MIEEWRALSDLDDQLGINVFQEEAECAMVDRCRAQSDAYGDHAIACRLGGDWGAD